jgi:hypothetical protein
MARTSNHGQMYCNVRVQILKSASVDETFDPSWIRCPQFWRSLSNSSPQMYIFKVSISNRSTAISRYRISQIALLPLSPVFPMTTQPYFKHMRVQVYVLSSNSKSSRSQGPMASQFLSELHRWRTQMCKDVDNREPLVPATSQSEEDF